MQAASIDQASLERVWDLLTEDYFLRYRPGEIAWHSQVLAGSVDDSADGLLAVRRQPDGDGIEAMLYTPRSRRSFAHATTLLIELGMTIADVRIVPLANDFSLDTYVFMELDERVEIDDHRLEKIRLALATVLAAEEDDVASVTRPEPRQIRMFPTKTTLGFQRDPGNNRTIMELVAADRPGLLSVVAGTFVEQGINIDTAKILTIGERAEDVFYITDLEQNELTQQVCEQLAATLKERIDGLG